LARVGGIGRVTLAGAHHRGQGPRHPGRGAAKPAQPQPRALRVPRRGIAGRRTDTGGVRRAGRGRAGGRPAQWASAGRPQQH
ncbi:hypothetical protein, partial [Acinetobacter baumannii]|uniref:hypothetical protein n=1 Tax=Acinetobacter baumannii TaxID=470 RepID=UPI001922C56F